MSMIGSSCSRLKAGDIYIVEHTQYTPNDPTANPGILEILG